MGRFRINYLNVNLSSYFYPNNLNLGMIPSRVEYSLHLTVTADSGQKERLQ